jgi:hypothetical protein
MDNIKIPGFTAETSLCQPKREYTLPRLRSAVAADHSGAVHPARFFCAGGMCGCQGDEDCNDMFSTACSSDGYARCWIRPNDLNVFCLCT